MTAPTTPPAVPPLTLTARTPEDVLALVPVVLGFTPHDSVAMLTFGAAHPFHARVDLPAEPDGAQLAELVDALVVPALLHEVERAFFVVYTGRADLARAAARCLAEEFEAVGIEVIEVLRTDGRRWWPAIGLRSRVPPAGVPYDLSTHPFTAHAVLEGRVLRSSREELVDSLRPDRAGVGRVAAALTAGTGAEQSAEAWAVDLLDRCCGDGSSPTDGECARLLRCLLDTAVRDALCHDLGRATAPAHVCFWSDVVRRCPEGLIAAPATLLALAAWQAGDGALAWCALDRCADADESYPLAVLVARALTEALPPEAWDPGEMT